MSDNPDVAKVLSIIQESLKSMNYHTEPMPSPREAILNVCKSYLDSLKSKRSINEYSIAETSQIVAWKMNKWGDLTYIHAFLTDDILDNKPVKDKVTKGRRQRPRRLLKRHARNQLGKVVVAYNVYYTQPIEYITLSCIVTKDGAQFSTPE